MRKKPTIKQRLTYAFDNTLASGTKGIILWLAAISLAVVVVFALIYTFTGIAMEGEEGMGFLEAAWQSLMRSVDPGTVAGDEGWAFRILGLLITVGGIFILSTLIGVLTTGLEEKLDSLRKGRSLVLESNHTLILGWSDKIFHIINQLVIANANRRKSRIVILSTLGKIEMEDALQAKIPNLKGTKIICRKGNPLNIDDITMVNPDDAKSIIILAPNNEDPDTYVLKSVMAVTNNPKREPEPYHIVAEIDDDDNMEAAHLVGEGEATYVRTSTLMARITTQTSRQSGLSLVIVDLLDYSGNEIYFRQEPELVGKTYKNVVFSYETSAVIGLLRGADNSALINPPMDTLVEATDKVIAISKDDHTIVLSGRDDFGINPNKVVPPERERPKPEKNVILGWNGKGMKIVRELDKYVEPGSSLMIIAEGHRIARQVEKLQAGLKNQEITFIQADISRRSALNAIDFTGNQNVIVLGYTDVPVEEADAKTLITLLHLRNIAEKYDTQFNIVSEMGDNKNRELAVVARADDFIISDNLISLVLTQLSESEHLKQVFDRLFSAEGSEIYLNPADDYVEPETDINFYTVLEAAAQRGESAIGYRLGSQAREPQKNFGIRLNPDKNERFALTADDKVIVVSRGN